MNLCHNVPKQYKNSTTETKEQYNQISQRKKTTNGEFREPQILPPTIDIQQRGHQPPLPKAWENNVQTETKLGQYH